MVNFTGVQQSCAFSLQIISYDSSRDHSESVKAKSNKNLL